VGAAWLAAGAGIATGHAADFVAGHARVALRVVSLQDGPRLAASS
jgi:hypothetical protein